MSRHPLNRSIYERAASDPLVLNLIKNIRSSNVHPAIPLEQLFTELQFTDMGEALACMLHACRILVECEDYSVLLVTDSSQECVGQVDQTTDDYLDGRYTAERERQVARYLDHCGQENLEIEPLNVLAMPRRQYQRSDGKAIDDYGVNLGTYDGDVLATWSSNDLSLV